MPPIASAAAPAQSAGMMCAIDSGISTDQDRGLIRENLLVILPARHYIRINIHALIPIVLSPCSTGILKQFGFRSSTLGAAAESGDV
jgi:hypothetical protein